MSIGDIRNHNSSGSRVIHTFCMEDNVTDVEYVASRLFYAAVNSGIEQEHDVDLIDRAKYEAFAKKLIPTLSIQRSMPPTTAVRQSAEHPVNIMPPPPNHDEFKPIQCSEIPTANLASPSDEFNAAVAALDIKTEE